MDVLKLIQSKLTTKNNATPVVEEPIDPRTGKQAPLLPGGTTTEATLDTPPADPNGTGGAGAATKVDKSNDIALQNAGINALESQKTSGLTAVDVALSKLTGQYDTEAGTNEKSYSDNSVVNQTNLQRNKQVALTNAAQGRKGLFDKLSSIGALSGTGVELANKAVAKGANDDLSGAAENYSTNQQGLDTSIGQFRQEDKMRRDNATTSAENAKTNINNDTLRSRLSFLTNLSNDYAAMGDEAKAKEYATQAAALYPALATTSLPSTNLAYSGAAFTPTTLANYMTGANSTAVSTTPAVGNSLPGLVATPLKKRLALAA